MVVERRAQMVCCADYGGLAAIKPPQAAAKSRPRLSGATFGRNRTGSVSLSVSESKGSTSFGHERLDVYRAAIEYVGWVYRFCQGLKGHRNAKEQLLRASQAIALNIAAGNGKATDGDRRRYSEIARGSAMECGAIQDVLEVCGALCAEENARTKAVLDRIVAMLTRLGRRGYAVREEPAEYTTGGVDTESDTDTDPEGNAPPGDCRTRRSTRPAPRCRSGKQAASRFGAGW
ncbi:four helix bundle protein [Candidatus Binatia bacterium]|nr:four helix bundle protein [Candidatus Binatia bacterium]